MRADARRNRERILDAAPRVLAEYGARASMETIARAAGLGVGTLYRHFPDRRALVEDIAAAALRDLIAFGRAAAATPNTRWDVLREVVLHSVDLPLALSNALLDTTDPNPRITALITESNTLLAELARAAQTEGGMRADITPTEVVTLFNLAVCRPGARRDDPLITVVFDGLATPQPTRESPPRATAAESRSTSARQEGR